MLLVLKLRGQVEAIRLDEEVTQVVKEVMEIKEEVLAIKEEILVIKEEGEGMVGEVNSYSFQEEAQEVISIIIPINKALIRNI